METVDVFTANITTLFSDILEHTDKYQAAYDAHFKVVEAQNPYQNILEEWRQKIDKFHIPFDLINTPVLPNIDNKNREKIKDELDFNLKVTIDYCRVLKPKKVHIILGDSKNTLDFEFMKSLLRHSVEILTEALEDIICLIEPLSIRENYYLCSYDVAAKIVQEINHPKLKILLDTYHLQRLHVNKNCATIEDYIRKMEPYIGHVQISQVPARDSPLNAGEIDFQNVIPLIRSLYKGTIGLEYFGETTDNFDEVMKFLNKLK